MNNNNYMFRLFDIIDNSSTIIDNNPYIKGVGLGVKVINNQITNIPCIVFMVHKKLSMLNLYSYHRIPKYINGVFSDVIEVDKFSLLDVKSKDLYTNAPAFYPKVACGGAPISNELNQTIYGTIAYALTEKDTTENLYILSCSHVLTNCLQNWKSDWNTIIKNKNIVYPPKSFQGSKTPSNPDKKIPYIIGELIDATKISLIDSNASIEEKSSKFMTMDAAIAKVGKNDEITKKEVLMPCMCASRKDQSLLYIKDTEEISSKDIREKDVYFFSSQSNTFKHGKVIVLNCNFATPIHSDVPKLLNFKNQLLIYRNAKSPEFHPRDAGALVISMDSDKAVGMVVSARGHNAYFTPINPILDKFNMKFA